MTERLRRLWQLFLDRILLREASTRSAALLRVGVVLLLWTRYATDLRLLDDLRPDRIAIGLSFWISTFLMLIGLWTRAASAVAGLTMLVIFYYLGIAEGVDGYDHHHTYYVAVAAALIALTPCGASYSVDRWRAVARADREGRPPPPERGPTWGLTLLCVQTSAVYFWGAVNKSTLAFMNGARMDNILRWLYWGSDTPPVPGLGALMLVSGAGTVLLEYALAFGLFSRRLQAPLMVTGILFHALIYYTMPVSIFTLTITMLYLPYVDPDAVHRLIDRLSGVRPLPGTGAPEA